MILPFSIGCVSQSSVAVAEDRPSAKKSLQSEQTLSAKFRDVEGIQKAASNSKGAGFLPLPPRPNLTAGFQRVIKGFRGLTSQLFAYKDGDDEEEEEERELQIGFPTDVQHVGHIGWDGTNTNALSNMMAWDGYSKPPAPPPATTAAPPDLLPMPSMSLRQFQMAMAAQADDEDDIDGGYSSAPRHHQLRTAAAYYN